MLHRHTVVAMLFIHIYPLIFGPLRLRANVKQSRDERYAITPEVI